jgi:hypothetical protein
MKEKIGVVFAMAFIVTLMVGILAFGAYVEVSLWHECHAEHSLLYCVRVLS